ncbi:MAG: NUMOD4 domain-containing protein, partial [Peptostreptococcaceae bacterium]
MKWKDIPGYEDIYKISEYGDVLSVKLNKKRSLRPKKNGYIYVDL